MSALVVRTEPLGGSPLARAALAGALPAPWFASRPTDAAGWARRVEEVRAERSAEWLAALEPALSARGAAAERLRRVDAQGGVVVTTGQQPVLFGGPIYTWSKALSALALADALEAATGVPTAPLFWAATDDADFAEAASTWVSLPGGAVQLMLSPPAQAGRALAHVPLGDVREQLAELERAAGSAAFREPLELVARAYAPDATVGSAYLALLRGQLEPLGIAVLDAAHPAVRAAADGLLRRALRSTAEVEAAVVRRAAEIEAAGYEPQVTPVAGLSLVFERADADKARVPSARAAAVAADRAAVLGPTVLLRPVMERALLPTVAYAAGPGELAYFAQVSAVAEALGVPQPLGVPRWSGTIIEPGIRRLLARYDLDADRLRDPHAAERELARSLLPDALREAVATLRTAVADGSEAVRTAGASLLPHTVAEGFARRARAQLDRLERRYRAAAARAHEEEFRDLATLRGALHPGGIRQERALNLLPLLARHGPEVLERMLEQATTHAASLVGAGQEVVAPRPPAAPGARTASAP